jgi:hypothetical protein
LFGVLDELLLFTLAAAAVLDCGDAAFDGLGFDAVLADVAAVDAVVAPADAAVFVIILSV